MRVEGMDSTVKMYIKKANNLHLREFRKSSAYVGQLMLANPLCCLPSCKHFAAKSKRLHSHAIGFPAHAPRKSDQELIRCSGSINSLPSQLNYSGYSLYRRAQLLSNVICIRAFFSRHTAQRGLLVGDESSLKM